MTAKDFAELHKGAMVGYGKHEGRVVGYQGVYVVLELDASTGYGWPRNSNNGEMTTWLVDDAKRGYYVRPDDLKLLAVIPKVTVRPYPHTCKRCRSNARKIGQITLCSNAKCKSRKEVKKTYKPPPLPQKGRTKVLDSGLVYYFDAWKAGGCVVCGAAERGNNRRAHASCWDLVGLMDRIKLKDITEVAG